MFFASPSQKYVFCDFDVFFLKNKLIHVQKTVDEQPFENFNIFLYTPWHTILECLFINSELNLNFQILASTDMIRHFYPTSLLDNYHPTFGCTIRSRKRYAHIFLGYGKKTPFFLEP